MIKFYVLLVTSFLLLTSSQAQVIVYHENFNNTVSGVTSTNFELTNVTPYSDTLYTAGNYAQTHRTASGQQVLVINNSISTYNLHKVTITWKEYRSQFHRRINGDIVTAANGNSTTSIPNTNPIKLEYSLDGVNFKQVTGFSQNTTDFFSWRAVNNGTAIQLPFAVSNQPNVRFRWTISVNNANTDYYAMDDVMIQGVPITGTSTFSWNSRPINERPFEVSSSRSLSPYTVDGVTMRWTKAYIGAGTAIESEEVNTGFLNKKTLNLIQSGASSTVGSQITLQLGKRVSGFTVTLHGIDRNAGQFLDKVQITAYDGTVAIPLTKNSMLPTVSNEFNNGAARAKANGVNAKVTSNQGNVTISFVGDIDRMEIRYFNDDAAKGKQGIAIGDMSWAMVEESIIPMPVELASFKGSIHKGHSLLSWVTAMEMNNDRFVVERSQDGKTFAKIAEVKGSGNSSKSIGYTFVDTRPESGTNYYRLQQIDFNGKATYSAIVAVEFSGIINKAVLYPTATSDAVHITLNGLKANVKVDVLDITGKVVKKLNGSFGQELVLPVQELIAGAYFVSLTDGEHHETLRFIKR